MLIFDFDGVICDSLEAVLTAFQEIAPADSLKKSLRHPRDFFQALELTEVFEFFGVKKHQIPMAVIKLRKIMKTKIHSLNTIPTLEPVLKTLHEQHIEMGIISSNSEENIKSFLMNNQIDYFSFIYSTGLFGKARILKKIVSRGKQNPKDIFYIGDEPRDIAASRKANVSSVAVGWGYSDEALLLKHHPDYFIKTPAELLLLKR